MAKIGHKTLTPDTENLPKPPKDAPKKGAAAASGKKGAADLMKDLDASSKVDLPKGDVDEILKAPPEADKPSGVSDFLDTPAKPNAPASRPSEAPYMADVPVVTGADSKRIAPSSSGSTTWDHSALKEARAARARLDQIRGTMSSDAYSGDIGSYIAKTNAVAALARQAQAADAQGSQISRHSHDRDMGGSTSGYDLGSSSIPTGPAAAAAPMPEPADPGMPISDVKTAAPSIAKNVTDPNKFKNFA